MNEWRSEGLKWRWSLYNRWEEWSCKQIEMSTGFGKTRGSKAVVLGNTMGYVSG